MNSDRPAWLNEHPKDLIFKFDLKDQISEGKVWFRRLDSGFEIDYFEIPEEHRGKGFGVQLLKAFINFCRSDIRTEIWLEVSTQNFVALKTYKSCGFKEVGLRPRYYADGSDAVLMTLSLDSDGSIN